MVSNVKNFVKRSRKCKRWQSQVPCVSVELDAQSNEGKINPFVYFQNLMGELDDDWIKKIEIILHI